MNKSKRTIEELSHFQCHSCQKWFSIGDAPLKKTNWYCAWCGEEQEFEHDER